jgi:hypothetical protein
MSDEEKRWNKKDKPTYLMVPKKFMVAIIVAFVCLLVGNIAAIQWSNYVDRRSNQRWCGIVVMFDNTYSHTPPATEIGKRTAIEFKKLRSEFSCK